MRPALKFGLLFAAGWIVLKILFKAIGVFQDDIFVPGLINNFFLLLAISLGLFFEKKKEGFGNGTALSDIKNGLIAGTPYAVVVSLFIFFYYKDISPEYVEQRAQERIDMVFEGMQRPSFVDSLKSTDAKFEVMTDEEIYDEAKEGIKNNFDSSFLLTFSLLGLIVLAVSYSILTTVIFRKILLRDYYK